MSLNNFNDGPWSADFLRVLRELETSAFKEYRFSFRERQVAHWMLRGESAAGIAEVLFLSESCIRYHFTNIYKKMNVKSRQEFNRKIRSSVGREFLTIAEFSKR